MKQKKCDICGAEAGYFNQDLFSNLLLCDECWKAKKHSFHLIEDRKAVLKAH
jgi:hypothetical protein